VLKRRAPVVVLQVKLPALTRVEQFEPFPFCHSSTNDLPFAHSSGAPVDDISIGYPANRKAIDFCAG